MTGGDVKTSGDFAHGLYASTTGLGTVTAQMADGRVTTDGDGAYGLRAHISKAENEAEASAHMTGGDVTTGGDNASGLLAWTTGLGSVTARLEGGDVETDGDDAHGLWANITNAGSEADARVHITDGDVKTSGDFAHGLYASGNGFGAAVAQMEGGRVTTEGSGAYGLRATTVVAASGAEVRTHMTGGDIETRGLLSHGLYANTYGLGAAVAHLEGGDVATKGRTAYGLFASIINTESVADAHAHMTDGDVDISGDFARGLVAFNRGLGAAVAHLEGGDVATEGQEARGLWAAIFNAENEAEASAHMTDGDVDTSGDGAYGLLASTGGLGAATAHLEGGDVETKGGTAHGLFAAIENTESVADARAHMTGGDVTTGGGGAHGVYARTFGLGAAVAQLEGGSVTTKGGFASGLRAETRFAGSVAEVRAHMTGGDVKTSGANARGLLATTSGLGAAVAQLEGGDVTTDGDNAHGLWAEIINEESAADARAHMTGGDVKTSRANARGLYASTTGLGAAVAQLEGGDVTTDGHFSEGLFARNTGLGAATAQLEGGSVTTEGGLAHGLFAAIENTESTADARAHMTDGDVKTSGDFARGLYASTTGLGAATARLEGGDVATEGQEARGLWAFIRNAESAADARAHMTGGDVTTGGDNAQGLLATTSGSGAAVAQVEGGDVTTSGNNAHGLFATTSGSGAATARMADGRVTTDGEGAFGLVAQSAAGQAIARLDADAAVRVFGMNADGIHAVGATGFDIDVAGSVTGGGGAGAAIRSISGAGGTIDIASGAHVRAGTSGLAIRDGDGNAVITSSGTILGDILLGAGDDMLTLTGGRFTGAVDGGEGINDQLVLRDQTMVFTTDRFRNWERLTLNDTKLIMVGGDTLAMDLSIDARSVFHASGGERDITIAGDVTNAGSLFLSVQDGDTGDVITIDGDYTGSGSSVFALDAVMGGDDPKGDMVVITGSAAGDMMLSVASLDSGGAEVTAREVDVVSVAGAFDGTVTLVDGNHVTSDGEHAFVAGAYVYTLAKAGDGRGWVLSAMSDTKKINWQPSAPIYDSYGHALLALNGPSSLRQRGSSEDFRSLAWDGGTAGQNTGSPLWFQMGGERITTAEEHSTTGAGLESSIREMEIGADIVLNDGGAGLFVGGLMLSYATGSTDVSSGFGDGSVATSGLGLGLAATWYDNRRFYIDAQMTLSSYTSDLSSARIGSLAEGNSGTGYAVSLEVGKQFDLNPGLVVIPQAQLSHSSVAFSDFTGAPYGARVTLDDAASQTLRLGLEFETQAQESSHLYGIVNLFHEFGAGSTVNVAGVSLTTESEPWAIGFGFGGTYAWNDRLALFGEASYATGLTTLGDTTELNLNAGLKISF
ncbi:autotransporter protein [Rhodobacteraceae bacterium KLH11]|nr:autotransporter protein [Rhodobacteraceae bacterium KLH11]